MYSRYRKISYLIISLLWRTELWINALPADHRAAIVHQNPAPPTLLTPSERAHTGGDFAPSSRLKESVYFMLNA